LAVVLFCGFVVCLCRVDLVFEAANVDRPAMGADSHGPFSGGLSEGYALVLRCCAAEFSPVACILRTGGGSEISLSIIDAIVINMIDEHSVRNFNEVAMHSQSLFLTGFCDWCGAGCIEVAGAFNVVPFIGRKALVVLRIDLGIPRPGKSNPSEGIAVAQAAVKQQQTNAKPLKPNRDVNKPSNANPSAW
jgi:hypothetical protein